MSTFHVGSLRITDRALRQFVTVLQDEHLDGQCIRVSAEKITPVKMRYGLDFTPYAHKGRDDDEMTTGGVIFLADKASAALLVNTTLDYLDAAGNDAAGNDADTGFKFFNPVEQQGWSDPVASQLQRLLDEQINPGVAAHGGRIDLMDFRAGTAYVRMAGGCQGCSMATRTLKQGVEKAVRENIPEVKAIVDTTDHDEGKKPYFD